MSSSFCQEDPSEATGVSLTSTTWTERFVLLDEEQEGQPGEKEKPGRTDAFTETGREGLLCVLRVQAQQAAAVLTYSGTAAQSLDDSSEDETWRVLLKRSSTGVPQLHGPSCNLRS
ncbi:unnamed protein product [Pleuronectes platessa]|uniref:Uncharacterized protein n=1 Tax=Pleuronectes platessa TaxID=8262 RepID=A0A9N7V212_PLEPL|nr:unnamed protein product [Pleuronectes platessa]